MYVMFVWMIHDLHLERKLNCEDLRTCPEKRKEDEWTVDEDEIKMKMRKGRSHPHLLDG